MKLLEDYSDCCFGNGSNPQGGGYIVVVPETQEDIDFMETFERHIYRVRKEGRIVKASIDCRLVKHEDGVPLDGGENPVYTALLQKYPGIEPEHERKMKERKCIYLGLSW